jgi:hypothetical protein
MYGRTARSSPPAPNPFAWKKKQSPTKVDTPAATQSIEEKLDRIWAKLEELDLKLEGLDSVRELSEKIEKVDLEVEHGKRVQIENNIIIVGLEEKEKEPYAELESKVMEVFKTLKIGDMDFSYIRRLPGKYTKGKPRGIQVKLMRHRDKIKILKSKKLLKGNEVYSKVYINPEQTRVERHQDSVLRETAKKWKDGNTALKFFIRGGRLIATLNNETHIYRLNKEGEVEEMQRKEETVENM